MKYAISRSINDISLNGQEFLLDPAGNILLFDTKQQAIAKASEICTGSIDTDMDLEEYGINVCQQDTNGNYEIL